METLKTLRWKWCSGLKCMQEWHTACTVEMTKWIEGRREIKWSSFTSLQQTHDFSLDDFHCATCGVTFAATIQFCWSVSDLCLDAFHCATCGETFAAMQFCWYGLWWNWQNWQSFHLWSGKGFFVICGLALKSLDVFIVQHLVWLSPLCSLSAHRTQKY